MPLHVVDVNKTREAPGTELSTETVSHEPRCEGVESAESKQTCRILARNQDPWVVLVKYSENYLVSLKAQKEQGPYLVMTGNAISASRKSKCQGHQNYPRVE